MADVLIALLLSVIAGASTGIGGLYAIFVKKVKSDTLGLLLGFSAGIMLVISFVGLIPEALVVMKSLWNPPMLLALFFTIGVVTMMILDLKVPHIEPATCNAPEEAHRTRWRGGNGGAPKTTAGQEPNSAIGLSVERHDSEYRLGWLLLIGITIHNLPEGLVVGASYSFQPQFGLYVMVAIMIHNIPEGLAVAIALIASNHRSKPQIIGLTLLSGLAEPIGALAGIGLIVGLGPLYGVIVTGFSLAFAAGIMVYITTDELIPTAHMECMNKHRMGLGLLLGMMFILFLTALIPPAPVV